MAHHAAAVEWAQTIARGPRPTVEVVSRSDRATIYRLSDDTTARAYLKVGADGLAGERDRFLWLQRRLPVPEVLGFAPGDEADWLLTAPLPGNDLSRPQHTAHPHRLVLLLARALTQLHSLDPSCCPFGRPGDDLVVVHGDACLPNFVFEETALTGYLDVGDLHLGSRDVDLAAAVWSLDYNLGPGFGGAFLRAYGWPLDDEATVERLRLRYETA